MGGCPARQSRLDQSISCHLPPVFDTWFSACSMVSSVGPRCSAILAFGDQRPQPGMSHRFTPPPPQAPLACDVRPSATSSRQHTPYPTPSSAVSMGGYTLQTGMMDVARPCSLRAIPSRHSPSASSFADLHVLGCMTRGCHDDRCTHLCRLLRRSDCHTARDENR